MKVRINGEERKLDKSTTLLELLLSLELATERIAVELNKEVVSKKDWEKTEIKDGDVIEIVHFVGGG